MTINEILVKEKFTLAKKYLEELSEITKKPIEEIESNFKLQMISERIFQVISQVMLSICTHIVAHSNESPPNSYADCMIKLAKIGVIKEDIAKQFSDIIRMRNRIIHQYTRIDFGILLSSLNQLEKDFSEFKKQVMVWLLNYKSTIK